ncbi:MAG: hypothetical protein LUH55_14535 [Bacteroides thetaiotaomicron]|nr:hypothetical protein [Bacteroides thetaiotaomicron]
MNRKAEQLKFLDGKEIIHVQDKACIQSGMEQNAITIDHCRKGRFECVCDRQHYLYLGGRRFFYPYWNCLSGNK